MSQGINRWGWSAVFAAAIIFVPTFAYAEELKIPGLDNWWGILWVAGGAALGWLGKMLSEIITGKVAARRAFIAKTTGQISDLAKEHYWALANHAGVLAGGLEQYLYLVDYQFLVRLLLRFDDPADWEAQLDKMAQIYAHRTFYDLCRLIWLFKKFQFDGSNTYLLTTHAAGRACQQFYNDFVGALPIKDESGGLDILAILDAMERRPAADQSEKGASANKKDKTAEADKKDKPPAGHELTVMEFNSKFVDPPQSDPVGAPQPELAEAKEAYRLWLRSQPDSVTSAAQALRAYNELLSHELASLYRGWFKHEPYSALPFARAVADDKWPEVLSKDTVRAIAQALGSELLQSLASGGPAKKQQTVDTTKAGGVASKSRKDEVDDFSTKDKWPDVRAIAQTGSELLQSLASSDSPKRPKRGATKLGDPAKRKPARKGQGGGNADPAREAGAR